VKLILKILFFLLTVFHTNIVEAKFIVFNRVVSEVKFIVDDIKSKNKSTVISENGFGICCKSENNLVDYKNWGKGIETVAAKTSSRIFNASTKQLQAKFKHAGDFGVTGNWNKAAAGRFNSAINQHINSTGVQTIQGTYRGQSVIHYVNPNTGLNVISSPSGQFISGWKLNPAQLQNVLKHGGL